MNQVMIELEIIRTDLLQEYLTQIPENMQQAFDNLRDAEISTENFSFFK